MGKNGWREKVTGDALLLYTGWKAGAQGPSANYDPSMVTRLKARGVTLVGDDGVSADHQLSITALGIYLIDNADLAQAAETAARLRRWQFALVVSPIPTPGATGWIVTLAGLKTCATRTKAVPHDLTGRRGFRL